MLPKVKIIVSLREPSTRFESQWVGMVDLHRGEYKKLSCAEAWNKSVGEIEQCVAGDAARNEDACMSRLHENGVVRSIYLHQVLRWLDAVEPSRVLVIQAEHLFVHTEQAMQSVARFLSIRPYTAEEVASFAWAKEGSSHMSEAIAQSCKPLKQRMDDYFRPYNKRLFELLQHKFPVTARNWEPGWSL
jgi:hypothetical protein